MKKSLLAIALVSVGFAVNAQVDTLTSHFNGNPSLYVPDAVQPLDSGYISGNNAYGDLAKMQLFDSNYGVTSGGTITNVLLGIGVKVDNGGSFQIAIWGDNNGQPANPLTPLGIVSATLASVDTAVTAFQIVDGTRFYNYVATFSTPVAIPANNKFWAGVVLPTGLNELALFSTNFQTNPFTAADTHSGEFWSNGSFHTFGDPNNWNADIALAIYPVVNLTASIEENVISANVYPNPANEAVNFSVKGDIETIVVKTLDGKVVAESTASVVNLDGLASGMYLYTLTTKEGKIATGNFSKN